MIFQGDAIVRRCSSQSPKSREAPKPSKKPLSSIKIISRKQNSDTDAARRETASEEVLTDMKFKVEPKEEGNEYIGDFWSRDALKEEGKSFGSHSNKESISNSGVEAEGVPDPFKDRWKLVSKMYACRKDVDYSHLESYSLRSLMVKSNDDLRQESLAMQLMIRFL